MHTVTIQSLRILRSNINRHGIAQTVSVGVGQGQVPARLFQTDKPVTGRRSGHRRTIKIEDLGRSMGEADSGLLHTRRSHPGYAVIRPPDEQG